MRIRGTLAIAAAVLCSFGLAQSALAANPAYESWAKHKPGTNVVMKLNTDAAGQKTDMETTFTLKEVTPEKVTVEAKVSMVVAGNKMDMPAQTQEILASAPDPTKPVEQPGQPKPETKTSEESVTVAGKEYKATVTESKTDTNGMKATSKVWTSPEVPGMTLKMEAKTEGAMASSTTGEVTKIEVK